MPGQVIPRGERRWRIRWFIGRDETGKRKYGSRNIHGTKKEAEAKLREILSQRDQGIVIQTRRISVGAFLDEWLEKAAKPRLRPRTFLDYQEKLKRYVRPLVGARRLDRLTPLEVQGMIAALSERGCPTAEKEKRKPLAPQTVRYAHAILQSALEQAVRWQMLASNPASHVQLPKQRRREMHALSQEEAKAFREAIAGSRFEALFLLLLGTGLRPGEALALQWADLDLEAGRVTVKRTLPRRRQKDAVAFEDPKTPRSRRAVPIPPTVAEALKRQKVEQAKARLAAGKDWTDFGLVFTTELGAPVNYRNLDRRHFKEALETAKLPKTIRLYDLRHSFASLAMAAGAHVKAISDRLASVDV
jgi:integrase